MDAAFHFLAEQLDLGVQALAVYCQEPGNWAHYPIDLPRPVIDAEEDGTI